MAAQEGQVEQTRQTFASAQEGTTNVRLLYLAYEFYRRHGEAEGMSLQLDAVLLCCDVRAFTTEPGLKTPPRPVKGEISRIGTK